MHKRAGRIVPARVFYLLMTLAVRAYQAVKFAVASSWEAALRAASALTEFSVIISP